MQLVYLSINQRKRPCRPLGALRVGKSTPQLSTCSFKQINLKIKIKLFWEAHFFLRAISLERVVVVVYLPKTYEKLPCKREPYRFSVWRDPLVHRDRHTEILLLFYKDIFITFSAFTFCLYRFIFCTSIFVYFNCYIQKGQFCLS